MSLPGLRPGFSSLNAWACASPRITTVLPSSASSSVPAPASPPFQEASQVLEDLAELTISPRQAGRIAQEVGQQWQAQRDQRVEQFQAHTLQPRIETHPASAVVEVDGPRSLLELSPATARKPHSGIRARDEFRDDSP